MNTKLVTSCLVAGALLLPFASYAADADSNRTSPKAYSKDAMITVKIKEALAEEKLSSLAKIHVDTDNRGRVSLTGTAATQEARQGRLDRAPHEGRHVRAEHDPGQGRQVGRDRALAARENRAQCAPAYGFWLSARA